ALLYKSKGNYAEALPQYERALAISEATLGPGHPNVATSLNNLARLYHDQGNYAEALPQYERALAIREAALGPEHPDVAQSLNSLAVLYNSKGNSAQAIDFFRRAAEIEETSLSDTLISSPETERQLYLNTFQGTTDMLVSLGSQTNDLTNTTNLALTTIFRRKGRILDSVTSSFQQLRVQLPPEEQSLLSNLYNIRTQISALRFSGLGNRSPEQYRTLLTNLEAQAKQLETSLSRHSAEFRIESQPATINAVQSLIPESTALVELVRYNPFNFEDPQNRWSAPPRYAAYTLTVNGQPQAIDLGEAAPIDALVADFRRALGTRSLHAQTIARQLDELVMAPIRPLLGDNTHILLSPDSQLNLIPFAALVTEDNRYLIEDYQITYLNSGRDLLRLQLDTPSQQDPVILANPDYASSDTSTQVSQKSVAKSNEEQNNQRSIDITNLTFGPLPGTAAEAEAIAPLLNNATVLTGTNATENALKQVNAPSILHIATHGFFLEDVERFIPLDPNSRGFRAGLSPTPTGNHPTQATPSNTENPLLRSGLALAGFNQRSSGSEDGVLTALEASGLNLYGTKLVVLSACDTGVGEASTGEGVYGLRRAFVTAGAESQLMSLWQVSDYGTSELMQLYYQNLKDGQGRSEALRSAQLSLLETDQYQHPYFWASFIFSGDWSPLEEI
ncbi:CHAT domain-containing protein, partial [Leptolyngbya cf. ectocarpi LEGE 11479]